MLGSEETEWTGVQSSVPKDLLGSQDDASPDLRLSSRLQETEISWRRDTWLGLEGWERF